MLECDLERLCCERGVRRSPADPCLYGKVSGSRMTLIGVYVDDLILASGSVEHLAAIKKKLSQRFKMTDLWEQHFVLGMHVDRIGNNVLM